MADGYISAVQLPGNNTYDIKDKNAVTEIQINGTAQTKTNGVVNLPAYPSDTKVTQQNSISGKYKPLLMGYDEINSLSDYSTTSVTNKTFKSQKLFFTPSNCTLTFYNETTTSDNTPITFDFDIKDTTTGRTYSTNAYMKWYQDHGTTTSGLNMVIQSGGGMFLGGGEAPNKHYIEKITDRTDPDSPVRINYTGEETFITSDQAIHIQSNAGTITNRKGLMITGALALVPEQADVATDNVGSIGTSSYRWSQGYFNKIFAIFAGDAYVTAKNTNTSIAVSLDSGATSNHGIWSSGYYDGTDYVADGKWIVYRSSDGVNYLDGIATKATQDSDGNVINSTYLKLSGGTLTGSIYVSGTTEKRISLKNPTNDNLQVYMASPTNGQHGLYSTGYLNGTTYTQSGKWLVMRNTDGKVYFNGCTIEKSVPSDAIFTDQNVLQQNSTSGKYQPILMGYDEINSPNDYSTTSVTNKTFKSQNLLFTPATGTLTTTNGYFKLLNSINTVTYQKTTDSGDTKYPAKWYCSMGKTPVDGDTVTITVPSEGGDSNGVYLSIEGNTNAKYKPISVSKTTKLTTHFNAGEIITLVYRATGSTAAIYPIGGGTATTEVSGGCWSVLNYYNTNTDTKVTDTVGTANTFYPAGKTGTGSGTVTQVFDTALKFAGTSGTTSVIGKAELTLGNATASGADNNKQGSLIIYGTTKYAHTIKSGESGPTAARSLTLPNKSGTIAVTSDITDSKVEQVINSDSTLYPILFSPKPYNDIESTTDKVYRNNSIYVKPSSGFLRATEISAEEFMCGVLYTGNSSGQGSIRLLTPEYSQSSTMTVGQISQPFVSDVELQHDLPSTSGTLLNDSIFKTIYNDEGTSPQFPSGDISYNITDFKEKIKFMDIHYTDANYLKNTSTGQQKSENFGYLRIPFDLIKDGGFVASTTPTIRFSLSLIGDQNSYYFRKQTYGFYVLQSGSAQSGNQTYTLYIQKLAQGLTTQFYGTPGTAPNWGNMTVRAHLKDDVIRILRITLILDP